MKILCVNVGLPREVEWKGRVVTTGIFKSPVQGHIPLRRLNLEGDRQADLSVHGGAEKAVYAYPSEHYPFWERELGRADLACGAIGENLTTEGLDEREVRIGDRFRIGTAELRVTQPRIPCYKLGIRLGRDDVVERFLWSGRNGFYLEVIREGEVGAGDAIEPLERGVDPLTVADIARLHRERTADAESRERMALAIRSEALPRGWRDYFRKRLESARE
jgi:MOSC domain-containing protein YiiM